MLVNVDKFRRILYLELPVKSKEGVLETIRALEKREDILYAGPDYHMEIQALKQFPNPVHDYYANNTEILDSISLPQAWAGYTSSAAIKVGVLDTGIDANHPALSGRINANLSRDFTNINNQGGAATLDMLQDPNGHGTHVAGIIAGATIVDTDIKLVSLRVFNSGGFGFTDVTPYYVKRAANPEPGWEDPANNRKGSNYGRTTVDLFAPGTAIYSTYPVWKCLNGTHDTYYTAHIANGYHLASGTSWRYPL